MATFTVPTSVVNPTTGDTVLLPGHASFVAGRTYTAILDDCVDGVGNHIAGRQSWVFTTVDSAEYVPTGLLAARPG